MIADRCYLKPHPVPHYRLVVQYGPLQDVLEADPRLRPNGHTRPAFRRAISRWSLHRFMRLYQHHRGKLCLDVV